jgi:sigma-B regulation protein RsbU (phosphoserine phosphatase)
MIAESVVVDVSQAGGSLRPARTIHRYATLFYGAFDENRWTLHYVNAGHNPAVVIRLGGAVTWLEASAPPVGLFAETVYQARALQLYPGDLIVAYTGGFVEATNTASEEGASTVFLAP